MMIHYRKYFPRGWGSAVILALMLSCGGTVLSQEGSKPAVIKSVANPNTVVKTVTKSPTGVQPESHSKADPRLVRALKAAGYKFEEIEGGALLRIYEEFPDGRSQQVLIMSQTQKTGALETRKIWSTAMKSEDAPSKDVANKLLMDTDKTPFGAWELVKWADGYRVLFVTAIHADLSPDGLRAVIGLVGSKADAMEKELSGADRF